MALADVDYSNQNRQLRASLIAAVTALWGRIGLDDPTDARDALTAAVPALTERYGEAAGLVATNFYSTLRETAGVRRRFTPDIADGTDAEKVRASVRWAIGPLFQETPDTEAAFGRVVNVADRVVLQQGDDTILDNINRDPARPRWAWVPRGKTCAWCTMKASRGAIFHSEAKAISGRHADCDCVARPAFDLPDDYDEDALYAAYKAGAGIP